MALWPAASASASMYTVTPGVADNVDSTPDDGVCGVGGICSLRQAVQTANGAGAPGFDTIEIPFDAGFGPYTLTRPNTAGDENLAVEGDIDITTSMEIKGTGGTPTISGGTAPAVDRIFHIPSGSPAVTLTNLIVTKGEAPDGGWGGGIKHESGSLTITNSSITDNRALASGARGGGIYSSGGTSLTLRDVNVNANRAPPDASVSFGAQGGGIYSATPINFTRVAIYSNDANFGCGGICGGNGGGLYAAAGGTLTNVTISGNIAGGNSTSGAGGGGGIFHGGDPLTLINSTIQHNYAMGPSGLGGGNLVGGNLRLQSTIISDGETIDHAAGTENCAVDNPPAFTSLGNNLEARSGQVPGGAGQCFSSPGVNGDITAVSAGLDSNLLLNGGTTYNHALLPGSPAIDAGALTGPATDQRGVSRPQGPRCDIGAFEREQTGTIPGSTCAGPPGSISPPGTGTTLLSTSPSSSPSPAAPRKKCKKKKRARAAKKCKRKRR